MRLSFRRGQVSLAGQDEEPRLCRRGMLWPECGTGTGGDETQSKKAKDEAARVFQER